MVDLLILLLFVGSGAAAGWLGIHLLPEQLVKPDTDAEQLRLILTAAGGGTGLVAGLAFPVSYTHLTLPTIMPV